MLVNSLCKVFIVNKIRGKTINEMEMRVKSMLCVILHDLHDFAVNYSQLSGACATMESPIIGAGMLRG